MSEGGIKLLGKAKEKLYPGDMVVGEIINGELIVRLAQTEDIKDENE